MGNRNRNQLYTDKEIGELIKRATELQKEGKESQKRGLSLEEIEHIAVDIGIDPEYLREAAEELGSDMYTDKDSGFWGNPFAVEQRRVVKGSVSQKQWEQIVQHLRRVTGSVGKTDTLGSTREWRRFIKDGSYTLEHTQVRVNPRDNQTAVEVHKHYRGGAYIAYLLGILLSGSIAGIFLDGSGLSNLISTAIVGGSILGGLGGVRIALTAWKRHQRKKLSGLMNWIHDTISQSGDTQTKGNPEIDIPEPIETDDGLEPQTQQTRRRRN